MNFAFLIFLHILLFCIVYCFAPFRMANAEVLRSFGYVLINSKNATTKRVDWDKSQAGLEKLLKSNHIRVRSYRANYFLYVDKSGKDKRFGFVFNKRRYYGNFITVIIYIQNKKPIPCIFVYIKGSF